MQKSSQCFAEILVAVLNIYIFFNVKFQLSELLKHINFKAKDLKYFSGFLQFDELLF